MICFDNINGCVKSVSNCQSLNKLFCCANHAQRFSQFGTPGNKGARSNNMIYEFEGKRPTVDPSAYISDSAVVIGDVTIGARCYIGPGAVIRADERPIWIGTKARLRICA